MVLINVINSGSEGNGYVIQVDDEILLLECGVKPQEMLQAIDFQTSKVSGCLVSHEHSDHAQYVKAYQMYGFPIITSIEVGEKISEKYKAYVRVQKRNTAVKVGNFKVIAFKVPHNETECDTFIIFHRAFGKLLFATDLEMCPYDLSGQGIKHLLVECNYSDVYLNIDAPNKDHVLRGHMEFQTCKRFIKSLGASLQSIGLCHASTIHGNSLWFKAEIEDEFDDKFVWIAEKNSKVILEG